MQFDKCSEMGIAIFNSLKIKSAANLLFWYAGKKKF